MEDRPRPSDFRPSPKRQTTDVGDDTATTTPLHDIQTKRIIEDAWYGWRKYIELNTYVSALSVNLSGISADDFNSLCRNREVWDSFVEDTRTYIENSPQKSTDERVFAKLFQRIDPIVNKRQMLHRIKDPQLQDFESVMQLKRRIRF